MLSLEEFKNKLEEIRKGTDNVSSNTTSENKPYIIPEEYKGHYSGKCGDCDYDTRMFEVCGYFERYLHYKEGSGIPPVIPEGYTDCRYMFNDCKNLTALDLSRFDVSKVMDMSYMFYNCGSLTSLDLSNFVTSKVVSMQGMFYGCVSLTALDLSNFDILEVTDMSLMFYGCESLTALDLPNFDTLEVTGMSFMFEGCRSLTEECRVKLKAQGFKVEI